MLEVNAHVSHLRSIQSSIMPSSYLEEKLVLVATTCIDFLATPSLRFLVATSALYIHTAL